MSQPDTDCDKVEIQPLQNLHQIRWKSLIFGCDTQETLKYLCNGQSLLLDNSSTGACKHKDENETEGDESSEEEVEPKLKYVRMANDLKNILFSDSISCVAVHPKLLVVGANWGKIYLLDHQGNIVSNKALKKHSVAVNQISIDISGEFIASCSDDGKVFICGLCTSDSNQELSLGRLVKSVAIDPNYYKLGSYRRFVTGDERLVLHERIFLARINSTVIGEAEGGVQNIKWNGQFIAWASDHGVRVYDVSAHTSLGFIKWNKGSL